MKRIDVIEEIVKSRHHQNSLIVSNIGYCSRELYSVKDSPNTFYMLGSMGLASSIGLGVALATHGEKEVIAFDGDGSVLMNLGTLGTIANFAPENYHLLIVDNESHGSTGGQESLTAMRTDLVKLAKAAGITGVLRIRDRYNLRLVLKRPRLPKVIIVECTHSNADVPIIPLSSIEIKERFMNSCRNGE